MSPSRGTWCIGVVVVMVASCGGRKPVDKSRTNRTATTADTAAAVKCEPPELVAVAEIADDDESSRVVIVEVATGKYVWEGPAGSGVYEFAWSPDGKKLAYIVEEDLIVHEQGQPDRLVYRGVSDDEPAFAFSRTGRYLAVEGTDEPMIVDLDQAGIRMPRAAGTNADCDPDSFLWSEIDDSLHFTCADDTLWSFDVVTGSMHKREVEDIEGLYGWYKGDIVAAAAGILQIPRHGPTIALRPFDDVGESIYVEGFASNTGLVAYTDYEEEDGYPRTIYLARRGTEPMIGWLQGAIFGMSFSSDGAWTAFATATEDYEEAGDIYLARLGEHKVTLVLEAIRESEDGYDDYEEDEYADEYAADDDEVYYIGYAKPRFRPEASACKPALPQPKTELVLVKKLAIEDTELTAYGNGVIVQLFDDYDAILDDKGELLIKVSDDSGGISDVMRLSNGNYLVETEDLALMSRTGKTIATLPGVSIDKDVTIRPGGGFVVMTSEDTFDIYDPRGKKAGQFQAGSDINSIAALPSGNIVIRTDGDESFEIDESGGVRRKVSFTFDEEDPILLSDGTFAYFEYDQGDEDGEPSVLDLGGYIDDDVVWVLFRGWDGKESGSYRIAAAGGAITLLALPNGNVAVFAGDERTKVYVLTSKGQLVGTNMLGVWPGDDPQVFEDGVISVVTYERHLYLIGPDGSYLGGRVFESEIEEGPFVVSKDTLVVQDASYVYFLRRRSI